MIINIDAITLTPTQSIAINYVKVKYGVTVWITPTLAV